MDSALQPVARTLFRAALLIFLVTIVIGILNGLDVWEVPRTWLLTHVHAGTLGWITLSVVGTSLLLFGEGSDEKAVAAGRRMAMAALAAVVLYVIAFATGFGIYRPIAGTLMLAAIVWFLVWVAGRYRVVPRTTPRLALLLATVSLTLGAVLGVLLGLFIANGSLPGLSIETAESLAGAHPESMLIGYLILAGVAVTGWLLDGPDTRLSRLVPWALFVSGLLVMIAIITNLEALIQVSTLLEVAGIVMFIVLMWSRIRPSAWRGGGASAFARLSVVFLAIGIGLFFYVVQLFLSGQLDPESGAENFGALIAYEHAMFVGVMTNALFAVVATISPERTILPVVLWGVNLGLIGFLIGLTTDSAMLKRVASPVMGIALVYGIYLFLTRLGSRSPAT
jgi:hypothetical protein